MKKAWLFGCLALASCGVINGNGYRQLSAAEKAALRPFVPGLLDSAVEQREALFEVELDGRCLASLLRERPYTWVYQWVYSCKAATCRPLYYYEQQARPHTSQGLSLVVVSQVYDPGTLRKYLAGWGFRRPVYVPAAVVYGLDMYRARKRFTRDLVPDSVARTLPAHLLFRHDTLVYAGADMPPGALDALVRQ